MLSIVNFLGSARSLRGHRRKLLTTYQKQKNLIPSMIIRREPYFRPRLSQQKKPPINKTKILWMNGWIMKYKYLLPSKINKLYKNKKKCFKSIYQSHRQNPKSNWYRWHRWQTRPRSWSKHESIWSNILYRKLTPLQLLGTE